MLSMSTGANAHTGKQVSSRIQQDLMVTQIIGQIQFQIETLMNDE